MAEPRARSLRVYLLPFLVAVAFLVIGAGCMTQGRPEQAAPVVPPTPTINAPQSLSYTLDRTTYTFETLADGGQETVTADDPADAARVKSIIGRLDAEARGFNRGEFSDPASIQGSQKQELDALHTGGPHIHLDFKELPAGAQVRFTTQDRQLVSALHLWFRGQVADHNKPPTP